MFPYVTTLTGVSVTRVLTDTRYTVSTTVYYFSVLTEDHRCPYCPRTLMFPVHHTSGNLRSVSGTSVTLRSSHPVGPPRTGRLSRVIRVTKSFLYLPVGCSRYELKMFFRAHLMVLHVFSPRKRIKELTSIKSRGLRQLTSSSSREGSFLPWYNVVHVSRY